jgi:hypothetical protein
MPAVIRKLVFADRMVVEVGESCGKNNCSPPANAVEGSGMDATQIVARFQQLAQGGMSPDLLLHLYGIGKKEWTVLEPQFTQWGATRYPHVKVKLNGEPNRFLFELFCASTGQIAPKQAAARLGMNQLQLKKILKALDNRHELPQAYRGMDGSTLFSGAFVQSFGTLFPNLATYIFSAEEEKIKAIHAEVKGTLNIIVSPLLCATAKAIGKQIIATEYDMLTDEPLNLEFEIWLKNNKPISLLPDLTSAYTYVRFEGKLHSLVYDESLKVPGRERLFSALRSHLKKRAS